MSGCHHLKGQELVNSEAVTEVGIPAFSSSWAAMPPPTTEQASVLGGRMPPQHKCPPPAEKGGGQAEHQWEGARKEPGGAVPQPQPLAEVVEKEAA